MWSGCLQFFPSADTVDRKSHCRSIPVALIHWCSFGTCRHIHELYIQNRWIILSSTNLYSVLLVKGSGGHLVQGKSTFDIEKIGNRSDRDIKGCCRIRFPSSQSWQEVGFASFPFLQWLCLGEGSSRSKSHFLGLWHRWCRLGTRADLFLKAIYCPQQLLCC